MDAVLEKEAAVVPLEMGVVIVVQARSVIPGIVQNGLRLGTAPCRSNRSKSKINTAISP